MIESLLSNFFMFTMKSTCEKGLWSPNWKNATIIHTLRKTETVDTFKLDSRNLAKYDLYHFL